MEELIKKIDELAMKEMEKYGIPSIDEYHLINEIGFKLAKELEADVRIVQFGTRLMDLKLGQAFSENEIEEHIKKSANSAKEILEKFNLEDDFKNKVINCIEAHHATKPFMCLEAEICANADAHRFLLHRSVLKIFYNFSKRMDFDEILSFIEKKMDEKYNIISLDICKKELEENYHDLKKLIKKAREVNKNNEYILP